MKIGVTQIILSDMSLDDTLDLCQEAGYEAVELVFRGGKDLDAGMSKSEIQSVGEKCAAAGIEIGSVIANYADRGNLLSPDAAERERGVKSLVRNLEIAGILGVGGILLHPGQLTVEGTYQAVWDNLVGILKDVAPVAASNQASIGVENVWNKFLLSPKEMREFVDTVGSEWVGTYLDTANMMAYGYPEHWIRELGSRITRVHFKDFKRREHQFVNLLDGDTDWPAVVRELRAVGYDGPVIHEVGGDRATQIDIAKRMRKIVAM
ncbi:MAG: sugar phosphate isomerase/epimerase [Candidatus Poribacteria bacterium]|nr:sugar phosphate isomerase/epimerase [Candidatus Poribacteria bacterium]